MICSNIGSDHFFRAFKSSSLTSPLKGSRDGFGLSFRSVLASVLSTRLDSLSGDLLSQSLLPSFSFIFFWYFRICWAANSKMLAQGSPFLQMARRKYSYASRIPDLSRTWTGQKRSYFFAAPPAATAPSLPLTQPSAPSLCPSLYPSLRLSSYRPSCCSSLQNYCKSKQSKPFRLRFSLVLILLLHSQERLELLLDVLAHDPFFGLVVVADEQPLHQPSIDHPPQLLLQISIDLFTGSQCKLQFLV